MAAQLQGLLGAGRPRLALAALALAACQGAPPAAPAAPPPGVAPLAAHPPVALQPAAVPPAATAAGLGPEILLPDPQAGDDELARVGDLVLRKSHAYTRLLSAQPKLALSAVDLLVFDVLVARHAEQHGIRVPETRVEALAAAEEQQLRDQVKAELGDRVDFPGYVWRIFGMRLDDWQRAQRLRTAQRLYQGYVIRYLALREERVQVRYLVHQDAKVCAEVVEKTRAGADFATLALRWSEDESRRDGGLLPPFSRGFQHPVATAAFQLQKGQVSEPFAAPLGAETRWFVVYCLDRMPARDVPFAAVQPEIDRDLADRPLQPLEISAYTLRWRSQLETGGPEARADR